MTNPLRLSGLGTGIDTDTLVARLMQVERRPLDQLNSQRARLEQRSTVFTELTNRLTTLQQRITALTQPATLNSKQLTSNNTGPNAPATGTANVEAATGSFQVWVDALATATTVQSTAAIGQAINPSAPLATAGFTIPVTTGTFRINGTAVTVAATDSLNDIITKINTTVSGVTATLVDDPNGRPNRLELSSSSPIQLGSGADTSNFLTAARVLGANNVFSGGLYRVTSTANIGATLTTAPLNSARLETALSPATGSFRINGQTITYNATQDSLSTVISRINSSSAGVTAAYDPVTDRIRLTANQTGTAAITLEDVTGNFLAATGVLSATQTFGQNAQYRVSTVNGGAPLTSSSNTVSNVVPGVTLTLRQVSPDPVTMTVSQNADATVNAVREFVNQYNSTMQFLRTQTTFVAATRTAGPFVGDSGLRSVEQTLRTLLTSPADGTT
ncbi:MAG: flagellar filament capping protein FliD, partial [Dehalococcoidia bacterium]|nr:flagellar filament capping protein FliD [Dehalococcoidia bacterium]